MFCRFCFVKLFCCYRGTLFSASLSPSFTYCPWLIYFSDYLKLNYVFSSDLWCGRQFIQSNFLWLLYITKHQKLGDLKKQIYYLTVLEVRSPKSRFQKGHILSDGSRGEAFLPLLALGVCQQSLRFLTCGCIAPVTRPSPFCVFMWSSLFACLSQCSNFPF